MLRRLLTTLKQTPIHLLKQLWKILTEPFYPLVQSDRRISIITSIFLLISVVGVSVEQFVYGATPLPVLIVLVAGYFIARTRWYKIALFVLIVSLTFPSYFIVLTTLDLTSDELNSAFIWLVLPLLLSSLIYSVRTTIIISILNIIFISSLPYIRSELTFAVVGQSLGFLTMVIVFIITVMTQRDQLEQDRQKELVDSRNRLNRFASENTHHLEQKSKRAQRLATLNEIGREISTLTDLSSLMENVYQQIYRELSADLFFIALYDKDKDELTFPLMYDDGRRWEQSPSPATDSTFSGKTILTKKPLLINEWTESAKEGESTPVLVGDNARVTKSLMFVPLFFGRETIGVISVQSYTPNAFNEEDLNLLSGISHQVTIAIQNTRLLEETKQTADHLSILNEVGRVISGLRDLPDLLEVIYEQGRKSISLDAFFVGLYHSDTQEISFPIMYDSGKRFEQPSSSISGSVFLRKFLKGEQSILINRTEDEMRQGRSNLNMLGQSNKISASIMAAPLISRNQVIGIISAQSYTLNAYDENDVNLLKGIANQVSIAIENSRLFTSAQQEIAERRRVEDQLRSAEARYRELVERVPAVIYSADTGPDGRWHYVSPQIEELLGYTTAEWMADPNIWFERIHPEDREYVRKAEKKAIENSERVEMEYRMLTRDNRSIWIHDESLNVYVSDSEQVIMQGFLMDITARKLAELTLKTSEEKYHTLFLTAERQAQELSLISAVQESLARELDLNNLLQRVVEEIAQIFGYTFVSIYILETANLKLVHQVGYDQEGVIDTIPSDKGISGKVVRTGQAILVKDVQHEPEFLRASHHIQSEVCVPLFDGDRIFGTLNIESAPTYQLNENDLRLLKTLAEQVNIAIRRARFYAERDESLRREQHINEFAHAISNTLDLPNILEKVTRLSVDMIGADSGTVSIMSEDGATMTDVYSHNDDTSLNAVIPKGKGPSWLAYEMGSPIIIDHYSEHPNAIPEWSDSGLLAFLSVPIKIEGKPVGALTLQNRTQQKTFTQRDLSLIETVAQEVAIAIQNARLFDALQKELTEHKITQERLLTSVNELENKNAELERFTYTVSHDLKSPLVTIGGFLGFLESDLQKENYEKIPHTINRIREAAKKMERLLNELLELSRIGRLINPPKEVPFGELVRDALELVDGQLRKNQVEVKLEAEYPIVRVDRIRMVEVLQNLLSNATNFMGDEKNPTIEIGMMNIDSENVFFIKDNGIGIAPEFHERIFGLFNKLDQFSEGTGIGLALVKRIIEVHGGRIWVESELGKGATFFFALENKYKQETL
jgi:PAS domain S-box-containing protein